MQPAISQARPHGHLSTYLMGLCLIPFMHLKRLYIGVSSCTAGFVSKLQNEKSFSFSLLSDHSPDDSFKFPLKVSVQQNT